MTALHKAAQQALDFCEFLWREVTLNDYAEELRHETEVQLIAALADHSGDATEMVYQISLKNGPASSAWVDVDEPTYKSAQLDSEYKCRIIYTRKQWMAWKRCYEK